MKAFRANVEEVAASPGRKDMMWLHETRQHLHMPPAEPFRAESGEVRVLFSHVDVRRCHVTIRANKVSPVTGPAAGDSRTKDARGRSWV